MNLERSVGALFASAPLGVTLASVPVLTDAASTHVVIPAGKVQWSPARLEGPFDITSIDPSDDPQTSAATR